MVHVGRCQAAGCDPLVAGHRTEELLSPLAEQPEWWCIDGPITTAGSLALLTKDQMMENLRYAIMMRALPGRVCACHPYYARKEPLDEHVCPCLLNFGALNRFLRAAQIANAKDSSVQLALHP